MSEEPKTKLCTEEFITIEFKSDPVTAKRFGDISNFGTEFNVITIPSNGRYIYRGDWNGKIHLSGNFEDIMACAYNEQEEITEDVSIIAIPVDKLK